MDSSVAATSAIAVVACAATHVDERTLVMTHSWPRHVALSLAGAALAASIWLIGCSITIDPDGDSGGGPSVTFTIGNASITLSLGDAGLFTFNGTNSVTTIADVVPFERPPDDMPVSAVVRIRPEDVIVDLDVPDDAVTNKSGAAFKQYTGSLSMDAYVSQRGDPNPCATGTSIGSWFLDVSNNVVTRVDYGAPLHNHQLQLFLDNGFTLCLRTNVDTAIMVDPSQLRGTVRFHGLMITFGPHGDVDFVDVSNAPPAGTTEACCWPPLSVYYQFNEPRQQICENLATHPRFGTPRQQCERGGGIWKGTGSSCASLTCDEEFRVCCRLGRGISSPCHEYTESYCVNSPVNEASYSVFPAGYTCESDPPPCNEESGACCQPDGSCRVVPFRITGGCPDGGEFQGPGTKCADVTCPMSPPPPTILACCLPNGSCRDISPESCDLGGGTPQAEGSSCAGVSCPQYGACCELDATCTLRTRQDCEARSATSPHTYIGDNTSCEPNRCERPTGACCDREGGCTMLEEAECTAAGGAYRGHAASCSPNPCEAITGACCDGNGNCFDITESECNASTFGYEGDGTSCATTACPAPLGACCHAGMTCTMTSSEDCTGLAGTYHGDGVACSSALCQPAPEFVVWYTGNVCCWGAPLLFITDRTGFEREEPASNFPGGGIDPTFPVVKIELQGGFASGNEARDWLCPQFTSSSFHFWCTRHYQLDGKNWQITGSLGCPNLGELPEPTAYPETNLCE